MKVKTRAPANAVPVIPANAQFKPRALPTTAPRVEPEEIPNVYGSQSGLAKSAWSVAPATASPSPTAVARIARGTLSAKTRSQEAPLTEPSLSAIRTAAAQARRLNAKRRGLRPINRL